MATNDWRLTGIVVALLFFMAFTGCCVLDDDDNGADGGDPRPAVAGAVSDIDGNTIFRQGIAAQDDDPEVFPGYANVWDIDAPGYMYLDDGGNDQFDEALVLCVETDSDGDCFGWAEYGELTFYGPVFSDEDGLVGAAVSGAEYWEPVEGNYTAHLNTMVEVRLWQQIDLTAAVGEEVTLYWQDMVDLDRDGLPEGLIYYQVVLRDPEDGSILDILFSYDSGENLDLTSRHAHLGEYTGNMVTLSFERRTNSGDDIVGIDDDDGDRIDIDAVSIIDEEDTEFVMNGDFETGDLTGWNQNVMNQVQNYTTAPQNLLGLDVTRSFFTHPTSMWARWTDTFTNNSDEAISAIVEYSSELGSDDCGIIYMVGGAGEMALAAWDGSAYDRDIGIVFGRTSFVDFLTDDGLCRDGGGDNGSDEIDHGYDIMVEPGEMVTIVNFIIMNGIDTGEGASSVGAKASEIDAEANRIINRFNTHGEYRDGMTLKQMATIINFEGAADADNCAYVAGDWTLYVTDVTSSCGGEEPWESELTVTQDGCYLEITGIKGVEEPAASGMVMGGVVMIDQAGYPDEGGTTLTEFTMTLDSEYLSMSGTEYWTWSGDGESCIDGTATATAEMDE